MKKTHPSISYLLGVFCLLNMMVPSLDATNLFAVITADSIDESIGMDVEADLRKMRREISRIAYYTNLDLQEIVLEGIATTSEALLEALDSWEGEVKPEDVVIFYFSGHGFRTSQDEEHPWPTLYFSLDEEGVKLDYIRRKLENYHPRLLIVVADACNNLIPYPYEILFDPKMALSLGSSKQANYCRLFLETSGVIVMASSQAGEFSYCTEKGSFFTSAFLKSLKYEVSFSSRPSWQTLLDRAALQIEGEQHPYYLVNVRSHENEKVS